MNQIKCAMKDCDSVFETNEPVSPSARFICKNHNRRSVLRKLGRKFTEGVDDADVQVHFQAYAHDKNLDNVRNGANGMS